MIQFYINIKKRVKGVLVTLFLRMLGCKVGRSLKCYQIPHFKIIPRNNFQIGDHVTLGRNVTFEIGEEGSLRIGDYVNLSNNILLSTLTEINIGNWSAIAENVSVRGSFHLLKKNINYREQLNFSHPINIGSDCGIGCGSVILWNATIPDGSFIGSLSLVTQSDKVLKNSIHAGNPLRFIRERE